MRRGIRGHVRVFRTSDHTRLSAGVLPNGLASGGSLMHDFFLLCMGEMVNIYKKYYVS